MDTYEAPAITTVESVEGLMRGILFHGEGKGHGKGPGGGAYPSP